MKIYKYPLKFIEKQSIQAPIIKILDIQIQGVTPMLWAIVGEEKDNTTIHIKTVGTGHDEVDKYDKYISSVQVSDHVWHYFESPM